MTVFFNTQHLTLSSPNATTCPSWTSWCPFLLWPKCNRLVRLGSPWGAVTLSRWGGWWYIYEYEVPGGALNLNSTNYPDLGHHGNPPLSGKNSHGRAGTSWLVVRIADHYSTRLVRLLVYSEAIKIKLNGALTFKQLRLYLSFSAWFLKTMLLELIREDNL
jgi:hypothetical protein